MAETLNEPNEIETPIVDAGLPFEGVIVTVPEPLGCGASAAFGVSVRVPEGCPVVPEVGDTPSHAGAPLTVNGWALPSLAPTVAVFAAGFPLPVTAMNEMEDGLGAMVTAGAAVLTVNVTGT